MIKNILRIGGIIAVFFGVLSCEIPQDETMSITERIQAFKDDLNNGHYDNLTNHMHPDMPNGIDKYNDSSVLRDAGALSSAHKPFTFGTPSIKDNGDGTMDADGSFSSDGTSGGETYHAVMKEDGSNNWKFYRLEIAALSFELGLKQ